MTGKSIFTSLDDLNWRYDGWKKVKIDSAARSSHHLLADASADVPGERDQAWSFA